MSTTTTCQPIAGATRDADSGAGSIRSLSQYFAPDSKRTREVVALQRPDGSTLVVDYLLGTLSDARLVAYLPADEPPENARINCELYLADATRGRCRTLTPEDFSLTHHDTSPPASDATAAITPLNDSEGYFYCIREVGTGEVSPELRWTRTRQLGHPLGFDVLTLRDVVARLESYEPARTQTTDALALYSPGQGLTTERLRAELARLNESPIVLNRRLREAVQHELSRSELTMSEIAMRCGRVKRDRRGNASGETSWLARRIGQTPEAGADQPCPWIHSDVLARIARDGLSMSPHEVELD